jgi:hypothetical protein
MANKFTRVPAYYMLPDGKGDWISNGIMIFESDRYSRTIVVPSGEINDLASIPRIFRRIFSINGPSRPAAALHDYLYSTLGLEGELTRKECDTIFLDAMLSEKMDFWLAYPSYIRIHLSLKAPKIKKVLTEKGGLVGKFVAKIIFRGVRVGGGGHFK